MVEQEKSALTPVGKFRPIASIYNPDLLSKQQLISNFVVRLKKFKKLFEEIRTSDMTYPEQPLMVVGLRGMGKTTLLLRLSYEVENNDSLNKWLVPIVFNEEEYGITKLYKFWEHIALYLERKEPTLHGLFDKMDAIYEPINNDVLYEQKAFELLIEALHSRKKKLLLFVDNFGDMFKRFNEQEKQRLREVVTTCNDLRIIAGSSVVAEAFYKYDNPFYELFKMERLVGLDKEETESLLLQLGENYPVNPVKEVLARQPHRVETLRRLTGGIPRSIVLLFEIFVDDKDGNAFTDLESILDRVTPLYKHRMDELPPQQQEIVNAIAHAWDAVSAKEVAIKTRLDSKLVSAQLKQLHQSNIVEIQPTRTKNHLYLLHDRFFNIWYLMRMARKGDKNRVLWLIRFLEQWCDEDQLSKRSDSLMLALNKGEYNPKGALYLSTALHFAETHDLNKRHELSRQTQRYLETKDPNLHEQLAHSDMAFFGKAMDLVKRKDYEGACIELVSIKDKNAQDYLLLSALCQYLNKADEAKVAYKKAIDLSAEHPERVLGNIYRDYFKNYKIAEDYYLKAIENEDFKALRKLGWMYEDKFQNLEKAEKLYHQAIVNGDNSAWIYLGDLYQEKKKDYTKAEEYYLKADEEGVEEALISLGLLYQYKLKNLEEAESFYYRAIQKGEIKAWDILAGLYGNEKKDYVEAEKFYLKAAEEGHVASLRGLGYMYQNKLKNTDKAEELYHQAIEKGDDAEGWRFLADLYRDSKKNYIKAEEYYLIAYGKGNTNALRLLGYMYYSKIRNSEKAEELFHQAIKEGESFAWGNLADLYKDKKKEFVKAEEYYLKASEEGHTHNLRLLGLMYQNKLKNTEKAEYFYHKAIEKGDIPNGWCALADLYKDEKKDYTKAEEYYLRANEEGHSTALVLLGQMYRDKLNNVEKAEDFYYQAIEKGDAINGWCFLGSLYRDIKKDYVKAEKHYSKAKEEGHPNALRYMGSMYQYQLKNIEKAEIFYRQAIEEGDITEGCRFLADLYQNEKKDFIKAEEYYLKASDEGHSEALCLLGNMYRTKLKDITKAETFYYQALENNETLAWSYLADLYRDEKKEYEKAEEFYLKANEEGHYEALRLLGWMYENKLQNFEKAEELYLQATESNHTLAWHNLGNLYRDEKKDYVRAQEYYTKAVEEGHINALLSLGHMYQYKLKDIAKAENFYLQASEKGNFADAWRRLGDLCKNEKKDYIRAEEYYWKANDEGHKEALHLLGWLYESNFNNLDKAEELYYQAINKEDTIAWSYLADLYRDKKHDYIKAEEYYLKASKEGHASALRFLGWMYESKLKNVEQAENFYRQAIEEGDATMAWHFLATLYKNEKKDYTKAEEYYLKASEEGHLSALKNIGWMHEKKLKNIDKAEYFYRQAIGKGDITEGWLYLADLYRDEKKEYGKAEEYYLKASEAGQFNALRSLGWMYQSKLKNIEKAESFYHQAIKTGDTAEGWWNLGNLYRDEKKDYLKAKEYYLKANEEGNINALRHLATMYAEKLNDVEKAEIYFTQALKKDNDLGNVYNSWAWVYFICKVKPEESLDLAQKAYQEAKEPYIAHTLASIYLWNNNFEMSYPLLDEFIEHEDMLEKEEDWIIYILLILAKGQYNFIYTYFNSQKGEALHLKDRFKPVWYAILYYIQDKYPTDYLRMPPEIKETVEEAIAKIEQMRIDYHIPI